MNPCEARCHTRMYCPDCGRFHPADQVERDGRVYWRIDCPKGARERQASSDARLFATFRSQIRPEPKGFRRGWSNCLLHITDACSLQCPICFADAPRTGWRMSLDEVRTAARRLKELKPYNVMLTGGEPSEHPDIVEIVRILAREYGFRCSMLTNGVRGGTDPDFIARLKDAGLTKFSLSFDTFDPEVSEMMKGRRDLVEIKLRAAERCFAANLNVGFVTTACRLNLKEIPEIIRYYIAHADKMSMYDIQVYQDDGRTVPGLESVDREEIVKTIVASGVVDGLKAEAFRIPQSVPAAGFCMDSDCLVWMYWLTRNGRAEPLQRHMDFDAFADDLYRLKPGGYGLKWLRFFLCYLRHFGWRRLRLMWKWEGRRPSPGESLQMITIESLMTPDRLDACRFGHCTGGVLLADGSVCPPCYYYGLRYAEDKARRNVS